MANAITLTAFGGIVNAASFIGGNYLAKFLSGDSSAAAEKEREKYDRAQEAYAEAQAKYRRERDAYFDWIAVQDRLKKKS